MKREWTKYKLMHKDTHVATIQSNGKCTIYRPSLMPYNLYLEKTVDNDIDTMINNLSNFYYWCSSRILTLDRKYAKEILNSIGFSQAITDKERAQVAMKYHAISLNDVYWIKPTDNSGIEDDEFGKEKIYFENINLYNNPLSNAFVDVSLRGKQITAQNKSLLKKADAAGDLATVGVAPKAWIRKDETFYLMKDGDEKEVEAEILASKIIDCFNVDHVQYTLGEYDNQKVSICKIITSLDYSIVPMEYVEIYAVNKNKDKFDYINKLDRYSYCMMNIIDYLIGNTDRHWGNWGFEIDNQNNKPGLLYSLMDFNKAFNSYEDLEGAACLTTRERQSQKEAAIAAVKEVGLNQIAEINPEIFKNKEHRKIFFERLNVLNNIII